MKRRVVSMTWVCAIFLVSQAHSQTGKVTVRVFDEEGGAVTNAEVRAAFQTYIKPGWGWGGGRPNRYTGRTDTNGVCVLEGEGNDGSVSIAAAGDGYYWSSGYKYKFTNTTGLVLKKWDPWNPTVDVVLKRVVHPIPMYVKSVGTEKIPASGSPVGFDLQAGDWVAPYGNGKVADMVVQMDRKPERTVPIKKVGLHGSDKLTLYDLTLTVCGSKDGDGFILVPLTPVGHGPSSALRMPHEALANGYVPSVVKRVYNSVDAPPHTDVRDDANYFFRIRTEKDENENITDALYGKIYGDFFFDHNGYLTFTYYLNPTSNDRNIEFDPTQNLFGGRDHLAP